MSRGQIRDLPKWEYKVVGLTDNDSLQKILNDLGKRGWEVVGGGVGGGYHTLSQFVLKRPL
tara:strand:- start:25 stop:207 length:183 start_codon:yes stop_codon:yes gene_type:complete